MKKSLFSLFVLLFGMFISSSFNDATAKSQTKLYICSEAYDANGVKTKWDQKRHLTFIQNKSIVYFSDANGYADSGFQFAYVGKRDDGILVYQLSNPNMFSGDQYLFFSPDLKRFNMESPGKLYILVYVQSDSYSTPPPSRFY